MKFAVYCEWDEEAQRWYVSDTDVPGLVAEAPTVEEMDALLRVRVPELIQLNMPTLARAPSPPSFALYTHREERFAVGAG